MTITYSLFGDSRSFEFPFYLRGIYFNARMNRILYPGIKTMVMLQRACLSEVIIEDLINLFSDLIIERVETAPKCESMLWRMRPLFNGIDVVCRDSDSVSTYRDACCVYSWMDSGLPFHAINDNDAHSGLMGGMVAFKSAEFIKQTGFTTFEQMVRGVDLGTHGSDQNFMNSTLMPKIKGDLLLHLGKGAGCRAAVIQPIPESHPKLNKKLWVTDLISRYIGSAGVIDFELLRFFKSNDGDRGFVAFERKHPKIFYWA